MEEQTQDQAKGKISFYYGKAQHLQETAKVVERFLGSKALITQVIGDESHVIVQAKKKPSLTRRALGLDQAVTVELAVEGNDLRATIGGAKWMDKAAGTAIGLFVFAPFMITAGWGVYKQRDLFGRTEKEIAAFLQSKQS